MVKHGDYKYITCEEMGKNLLVRTKMLVSVTTILPSDK